MDRRDMLKSLGVAAAATAAAATAAEAQEAELSLGFGPYATPGTRQTPRSRAVRTWSRSRTTTSSRAASRARP
jgi:hypothetical protein